jgi:hypothetical protein
MSGGKGGSSSSQVEIPEYIEVAAQRNLNKAEDISRLGYVPYYGPDVAAFTPMQQAAFQNTGNLADSFGMASPATERDLMGGMNDPTTYRGGVQGYSSQPLFQQSKNLFREARPGQRRYIDSFFINPRTSGPSNVGPRQQEPIDYTAMNTLAQEKRNRELNVLGLEGNAFSGGRDAFSGAPNVGGGRGMSDNDAAGGVPAGGTTAEGLSFGQDLGFSLTDRSYDPPGSVMSRGLGVTDPDSSPGDGIGGCVVATHAVEAGAFTPSMKREAVVWCMNALHGKWWGEAIRRGYRHLGRKKIAQGKAREHYAEFRRYINFASGKDRNLRGAATFALRTAQFFLVGIVKRDA